MLRRRDLVWVVVLGVVVVGLEFVSDTVHQGVAKIGFIMAVTAATFLLQRRFRPRHPRRERASTVEAA